MSRFRTIQYMVDPEMGLVYSRVGGEIAIPVIEFDKMVPQDRYALKYALEKFNVLDAGISAKDMIRTRKIPLEIKNYHRKFWGMKPLQP